MKALLLPMIALLLSPPLGGMAQEPRRFNPGDGARVNAVNAQGVPTQMIICSTRDELAFAFRAGKMAAAAGKIIPLEGMISLSHNSPVEVEKVDELELEGGTIAACRVKISSGALAGQLFWIPASKLRYVHDADPAADWYAAVAKGNEIAWDGEYSPRAGDPIVLAHRTPRATTPDRAACAMGFADLGNGGKYHDALLLRPGTKATIIQTRLKRDFPTQIADYVQVRIQSGPLRSLDVWTLGIECARPEVYSKTVPDEPIRNLADDIRDNREVK